MEGDEGDSRALAHLLGAWAMSEAVSGQPRAGVGALLRLFRSTGVSGVLADVSSLSFSGMALHGAIWQAVATANTTTPWRLAEILCTAEALRLSPDAARVHCVQALGHGVLLHAASRAAGSEALGKLAPCVLLRYNKLDLPLATLTDAAATCANRAPTRQLAYVCSSGFVSTAYFCSPLARARAHARPRAAAMRKWRITSCRMGPIAGCT